MIATSTFAESNQLILIIPSVLAFSVQRVRVDVIRIHNVKEPSSVALTTVQLDHPICTAVQVAKVENV